MRKTATLFTSAVLWRDTHPILSSLRQGIWPGRTGVRKEPRYLRGGAPALDRQRVVSGAKSACASWDVARLPIRAPRAGSRAGENVHFKSPRRMGSIPSYELSAHCWIERAVWSVRAYQSDTCQPSCEEPAPDDETPDVSIGDHDGLASAFAARVHALLALTKPRCGSSWLLGTTDALWRPTAAGTGTSVAL